MGVFLGGIAAVCWGVGDYLIAVVTHRIGTTRAMALTQTFTLLAWIGLLLVWWSAPIGDATTWALTLISAVCYVLAMWLSYRAFEIGSLAVVSPISSSFVVVTTLLALISGERPTVAKLAGAAALFIGVILVSRPPNAVTNTTREGIPHAIGAALAFGIMFWLLGYVTPEAKMGHVWPLVIIKIIASGAMWLILGFQKSQTSSAVEPNTLSTTEVESVPDSSVSQITIARATWAAVGFAALDTIAWIAYILGTRSESTAIVTAVASLFSAVAVMMGWAVLRERLAPNQWTGIAVILLGILLVSI